MERSESALAERISEPVITLNLEIFRTASAVLNMTILGFAKVSKKIIIKNNGYYNGKRN